MSINREPPGYAQKARAEIAAAVGTLARLVASHDLAAADVFVCRLVAQYPEVAEAWALEADVALIVGDAERALVSVTRALERGGTSVHNYLRKARAYHALRQWEWIAGALDAASAAAAGNAGDEAALGDYCSGLADYRRAFAAYDRAIALAPGKSRYWFNRATVHRFLGNIEAAQADYDRCLALDPKDAQAQLNRSELRPQTAASNHLDELEQNLAAVRARWQDKVTIHYALAKEYEDLRRYQDSWRHLTSGATLRRKNLQYDVRIDLATVDWLIEAFPRKPADCLGAASAEPIFIVGMPRSGSTLLERMLGRHPDILAAGELNDFGEAINAAVRRSAGRDLDRRARITASAQLNFVGLGEAYLQRTRRVTGGEPRFTDKLPLNYLYCGLIDRALPRARIVHVTRHPLATCYSIYKTLFDRGYPFSYNLDELAAYYIGYRRLMQHWNEVMAGRIIELQYESLVAAPEAECRRLLEGLGLDWHPQCAEFHLNPEPTSTASASQVRRPLHREGLDHWRHFAHELAPLRARLEAGGIAT